MTPKRKRPQFSFTTSKPAMDAIEQVAKEIDGSNGRAIDVIVREWLAGKEIEPLKCKLKPSDLSNLQNTLDSIDARLSRIEGQLTDGDITIIEDE